MTEEAGDFDKNASIAWSDDLLAWHWPGKNIAGEKKNEWECRRTLA